VSKEKTAKADQLTADRRALGSLLASMHQDAERVRDKAAELREAIERLNERYLSACQRREKIIASGGEDPGPIVPPVARVGVLEMPVLREYPPRKRMNLRRTPEQLKREEEKRKREAEAWERATRSLPNVANLPSNIPLGTL